MIRAKDGEVILEGERCNVMAEAVTVLRALKEVVSEEEYKTVLRLADKSPQQVKAGVESMIALKQLLA